MNLNKGKQQLGIWMTASLVVGNMIGGGIFMMPSTLAEYGGISILGWLVSSLGAVLLAVVFSKLSRLVTGKSGGPYAYARAGFGDYVGFLVAWGYWIAVWVAMAALAIAFVSAMSTFLPILNEKPWIAVSLGLAAVWLLTWINSLGVRTSGKLQVITTLLKIIPILLIILGGFFFFEPENFVPFNASEESAVSAIAITGTLTLYAFLGLESASVPTDNVKAPEKTIPRATMLGTVFTTALYILSTVAVMGLIPLDTLAKSPAPFADAMKIMSGDTGSYIVAGGVAMAAFGALNGWILIQSQVARAIALDGLFPAVFRRENKAGVPIWGLVIGSLLASILMLMNYSQGLVEQFKFAILLSTICTLVPYLFAVAAFVGISLEKGLQGKQKVRVYLLGALAFAFSIWAVYGAGETAVFLGFILLMLGTPFYVWLKWKKRNPD